MLLPKQSPPVERSANARSSPLSQPKTVRPQMTCGCLPTGDPPVYTWWCQIGRTFYNTEEACEPE